MSRYKIVIQYDGTNFSGFQSQKNQSGIQDNIESSISKLNNDKKIKIYGASRTDAGVHALGQVAHFNLDSKLTDKELHRAINARLDKEIRISHLSKIEESFHSRFDAKSKEYNYLCCLSDNPLYLKDHYHVKNIDIKLLMEVSKIIEGKHNFLSFSNFQTNKITIVKYLLQNGFLMIKIMKNYYILFMEIDFYIIW